MTAERRRQLLMGGGVGSVLVLAMWLMWPASPSPSASGSAPVRGRAARGDKDADVKPVDAVKLNALKEGRDEPGQASRNPFRFQPKAAPPPPPRAEVPAPTVPVNMTPARPAPPPGPPPLPPIPLKFLGVVTRQDGVKWAVLTDGKSGPQHGTEGSIIEGRYKIVKIGEESIEMTYVDGRGRQVIRLTGQ